MEASKLYKLLRRINLGGLVDECVVHFDKASAWCKCTDLTNSVLTCVSEEIESDFGDVGINNLSLLTKFLSSHDEITKIIRKENRINISKGNRGILRFLLSDPAVIPTELKKDATPEGILDTATIKVEIKEEIQKDLDQFIKLTGQSIVTFKVTEKGKAYITGVSENIHQFQINLGSVDSNDVIETHVFADNLKHVVDVLEWGSSNPTFQFSNLGPLIIVQNNSNFWGLTRVKDIG